MNLYKIERDGQQIELTEKEMFDIYLIYDFAIKKIWIDGRLDEYRNDEFPEYESFINTEKFISDVVHRYNKLLDYGCDESYATETAIEEMLTEYMGEGYEEDTINW